MIQPILRGDVDRETIQKNITRIQTELSQNRYRDEPPAKLIAVTKSVTAQVTNQLLSLGQTDIAENRAQNFLEKYPFLEQNFKFHWIGHLQSNKIKCIIGLVSLIHSLDHMSVAQEIERRAGEIGRVIPALVQVNIAGEAQKGGLDPNEVRGFLKNLQSFQSLQIIGLMSIMPKDAPEDRLRLYFRGMRELFDDLRQSPAGTAQMQELSMGMSGDYRIAAQEGSTMVRIGSALFSAQPSSIGGNKT